MWDTIWKSLLFPNKKTILLLRFFYFIFWFFFYLCAVLFYFKTSSKNLDHKIQENKGFLSAYFNFPLKQ